MAGRFGKVAVLMGGDSAEREISLISGQAVLAALLAAGIKAYAFDPAEQPIWRLVDDRPDAAFIALHGGAGEDGTVQAALDLMKIPYTGSGVLASALALDKRRTTLLWRACGLPVPRSLLVTAGDQGPAVIAELGLPLIVKPVREGSSIGVTKVMRAEEFAAAFAAAATLPDGRHEEVMAEEFIMGTELTAAVLGRRALPLVRIEAPAGRYDYQNKYFTDVVKYHCPAGIDAAKEAEIARTVLFAFDALGCRGWGRADLILLDDGSFRLLEMNTAPGMTGHSLVPMAAKAAGIDFTALVLTILAEARCG
ncbi:D-alanine--D-alanine ligase [Sulfuricystis multivorans]|uniref:D-alanine--D-alanine ligase n=1 Tax=Sulfuricystis multivorans TaxID=2211108 RepID=UPI000F830420|nr:D-alanine--D-alanine ligase [Sulfuricystis multivorans]